ncbi:oligosaccharide flippase family protein [Jannaschia sp. W003]|uniref:oligosaccharide flippase family protein n=1 Tax=Jannaschia sp. W003 TaxID=2867012 RepID=UPI0021A5377A|nr:oligosaccharide flippase family protein [Jannaschia sp. W003]UWQ21556.1 oligosaccharide flippase family protein [Jannaschia sp. W003]
MSAPAEPSEAAPPQRPFFLNVGALVLSRGFVALSQILILPILARLLSIADFGVMALAMTVVVLAGTISDGGFGRSLIRTRRVDRAEWSSVFWLLVAIGVGLAAAVLAAAPLLAAWFDQPRLLAAMCALAALPLLQAATAAHNAEIERREQYGALAALQAAAAAAGMAAAVGLALLGAGLWALVAQQLALAGIRAAGIVALSRFRPAATFSRGHLTEHLRFARDTIATSLLSVMRLQATTLVIGRVLGPLPLGVYAMHQRFARLPQFGLAGPASAVVFVRMARARDDPPRLARTYLASVRLLATVLLPGLGGVVAAGPVLFPAMLSEKWSAVAPVFALAVPGVALEAVTITTLVCVFRATGRTDVQVRLTAEGTLLCVALVLAASSFGLLAVAAAISVWALAYVPRGWALARRIIPLGWGEALGSVAPALTAAVGAGLAIRFGTAPLGLPPAMDLSLAALATLAAYLLLALADLRALRGAVSVFR